MQVAKLAGVPQDVIRNAKGQLAHLEGSATPSAISAQAAAPSAPKAQPQPSARASEPVMQGDMFASLEPSVVEQALKTLELDNLTPREALNRLYELKELLEK